MTCELCYGWVLPVLRSVAACAPWLAAGAAAAGRTGPADVGTRSGSRQGGVAGEGEGLCFHTREATGPIAPGPLR